MEIDQTNLKDICLRASSSALDTIGKTPLVRIAKLTQHLSSQIIVYAKPERGNSGGSVKDRTAFRMISDAEASGLRNTVRKLGSYQFILMTHSTV